MQGSSYGAVGTAKAARLRGPLDHHRHPDAPPQADEYSPWADMGR